MQRNRYILCLLACGLMLYFAVPHLTITAPGPQGVFSVSWLLFALFVIAGNLTGILFGPKEKSQLKKSRRPSQSEKKSRSYH